MKLSKILQIVCVSAGILGAAACSNGKKHGASDVYGSNAARDSAATQAYATKDEQGFGLDASGRRINPLTAPANNSYYFDFNSDNVRSEDNQAMSIQANYIASHPNVKVRLEGNTDNRGSSEYNVGLGWRRDQAVQAYLEQQGVKPSQIEMVSYGKERPCGTSISLGNNDEKAWSLNRRVDLIYKSN
jgi:peptidoglycan-associated lipoprotein